MRHSQSPVLLKATLWSRRRPLWKPEPSSPLPTREELPEQQRLLRLRGVPGGPFCSSSLPAELTFLRSEFVRGEDFRLMQIQARVYFWRLPACPLDSEQVRSVIRS